MSYSIYTDNAKILSLGIEESSSGMTTAYWSRYYTFNSGNGDLIQLSDLFTAKGYNALKALVVRKSIRKFKEQLKNGGEKDSIWTEVIQELKQPDMIDFYIKGNNIYIDTGNDLGKWTQGWDYKIKFYLSELELYLNDYGKCVFGLYHEPIAKYKSQSLPQLFTGKIDKYPVLFILRPMLEQEYEGIYCYQKYGKGIYMKGTKVNGQINLEEYNSRFNSKANIAGKINKDSIVATWTETKNSKPLQLVVYRK